MLVRLADRAAEIAVARLVESDEEDERVAVLEVQDAVLLPGEARPQLAELGAFDGARVGEGKPRTEESRRSIACLTFTRCLAGRSVRKSSTGVRPCGVS